MVCCMGAPVPGRRIGEDRQQGRFLTARRLRAAQSCRTNWRKQVASCEKVASYLVRNLSEREAAKKFLTSRTRRGFGVALLSPSLAVLCWAFSISSEPDR